MRILEQVGEHTFQIISSIFISIGDVLVKIIKERLYKIHINLFDKFCFEPRPSVEALLAQIRLRWWMRIPRHLLPKIWCPIFEDKGLEVDGLEFYRSYFLADHHRTCESHEIFIRLKFYSFRCLKTNSCV